MALITDLSDLINLQTGGNNGNPENVFFHKVARVAGDAATAPVAGRSISLWRYDGTPGGGSVPTTGETTTLATTGAIQFTAPSGGRDKILVGATITSSFSGVFLLYDRLFQEGGFSGTLTTDQTVQGNPPSPALTRYTGGTGNIAFYEIYTQIGATSRTLTITYTNELGVSGRTGTATIGGTGFQDVTRMGRIQLAAGDNGVRAIEKISLNASTGTAGNFGITIGQPLAWLPVGSAGVMGWRDWTTGLPGTPILDPNACLSLFFVPQGTSAPEIYGSIATVEN
jgi:hypothetical protein